MNILLVEDNPESALVLEYALSDAGHHVVGPVGSAAGAYSLALNNKPQLALIDIGLADGMMAGTVLAKRLQCDFSVPSLYITGDASAAQKNDHWSMGSILKPYKLQTVLDSIEAVQSLIAGDHPKNTPPGLRLFRSAMFYKNV